VEVAGLRRHVQLIEGANRIFGFGGWSRETLLLEALHEPALCKDETSAEKDKVVSTFFAKVRITVYARRATTQ
jgi:recombination DNA repair RAD52 pathway protein